MERDTGYLIDMLVSAKLAVEYLEGTDKADFVTDVRTQDAVVRRLEIIGEASRRLSEHGRASLPDLPWHAMVSMRNLMIHEYDGVDYHMVWDTVKQDLPSLIQLLEKRLGKGATQRAL
ncbi:MAG: DUF86 domain-containing protein [Magnetococcales bacterium]|nr:DUF86 domain-containing protein [Magnetococcales bacterium]MBF0437949.1 DUF86 domain-containing protein [Magnetococcales bacterium]